MDAPEGLIDTFSIADHRLIRCVGRGSYGQVWLAQNAIGTYRAVKIVRRKDFDDDGPYLRELKGIRQFEPISRSHPGFIHVLQVGQDPARDYFYYVMELGDDACDRFTPETYSSKTLDSVLRSGERMSIDEVIRVGLRLTDALYTLHEKDLIHRDIKPSNILLVGGIPKLADIGLVTSASDARSLVGTPGYMPPEGPGTRQADVYALGKVFYECLTGLDRDRFPELPTFFDGDEQESRFLEINAVISRACHHDPGARYPSAREFHAELTAIENGQSVVRLHELERKWASAKRWGRVAAVAGLVIGSVVFAIIRESTQAERDRQRTVGLHIGSSLQAVEQGSYAKALRDTAQVLGVATEERSQQINRMRYAAILGQVPKLVLLQSFGTRVSAAQFTPDGEAVLVALGTGRCMVIDGESGEVQVSFAGHSDAILHATVSPDGRHIATAGMDRTARIWDRNSGHQLQVLVHPKLVTAVNFHPSGSRLITASEDGVIRCWDPATGKGIYEFEAHPSRIDGVGFSHGGTWFATAGRDNKARLWRASTGEPFGQPISHSSWVTHVAFSPNDLQLVSGCHDSGAYIWAVDSQRLFAPSIRHQRAVRHVQFSPDGQYILTAGWDNVVRQWNPTRGEAEECALKHSSPVMCANYSPDSRRIVTGCVDGTLRIWDQAGKEVPRVLQTGVAVLSSDGSAFLTRNETNLNVYAVAHPEIPRARIVLPEKHHGSFLNHDGSLLGSVIGNDSKRVWCEVWATGSSPHPLARIKVPSRKSRIGFGRRPGSMVVLSTNHTEMVTFAPGFDQTWPLLTNIVVTNAVFSPDNRSLALVAESDVFVFETEKPRLRFQRLQHRNTVKKVVFSPDGRYLVSCTGSGELQACSAQVWDAWTGGPVGPPRWHSDGVDAAAWLPDSKRFVTVGEDGIGHLWSVEAAGSLGAELKHDHEIESVVIHPEPELVLTASQDWTMRLWDAEFGYPIGPPVRFPRGIQASRFAGEGRQIVTLDFVGILFGSSSSSTQWRQSDLMALAHVLDGRTSGSGAGNEFEGGTAQAAEWKRLRTAHDSFFVVSNDDIATWHRMQAEQCRSERNRPGELLHLNLLVGLVPGDRLSSLRRDHLTESLGAPSGRPAR